MRGALSAGGGVGHTLALAQGVALSDSEAVLLIDDHEPQEGHPDGLAQQRVRAHDDGGLATGHSGEDLAPPGGRGGTGQQHDPGGALRPSEHAGPPQRAQERLQTGLVLGGQNLGGG